MAKSISAKQQAQETREANARIRAETRAQKAKEKVAARGVGSGMKVLARCQSSHPDNPKGQLAMFLSEYVIKSAIGRTRPVSARTHQSYSDNLMGCIDDLRTKNAAVRNLGELNKKHVLILIKYWMEDDQANSTVQNKISVLRCFLGWIGKEDAAPRSSALKELLQKNGIDAPTWKSAVATESKAWVDKDVDFYDVLRRVNAICPLTGMQLEMSDAFGLRMRECLSISPIASDFGGMLQVNHGTKGGLPRSVPFSLDDVHSARQRDVLERAKVMADKHPKRLLTRAGDSLEQNVRYFYRVMHKAGITLKDLGVTAHGLRHQFAGRFYEEVAGMPTPVSGGLPYELSPEEVAADIEARGKVSRAMGHFRSSVTGAYVGTVRMMKRQQKVRVTSWVNLTEGNDRFQAILKKFGVAAAWLGGRFASGLAVTKQEPLRLYVKTQFGITAQALMDMQKALGETIMRRVDASEFNMPGAPDDALAIDVNP